MCFLQLRRTDPRFIPENVTKCETKNAAEICFIFSKDFNLLLIRRLQEIWAHCSAIKLKENDQREKILDNERMVPFMVPFSVIVQN